MVNNEFGRNMNVSTSNSKNGRNEKGGKNNGPRSKVSAFIQPDGISNRRIDSSKDQSAKFVATNIEYGDVEGSKVLDTTRNARLSYSMDFEKNVWRRDTLPRIVLRQTLNVLKADVGSNIIP